MTAVVASDIAVVAVSSTSAFAITYGRSTLILFFSFVFCDVQLKRVYWKICVEVIATTAAHEYKLRLMHQRPIRTREKKNETYGSVVDARFKINLNIDGE